MRAWAIVATVVAAGTLAAGGTLAAMLLRGGISARSEPSSLEASLAFKARRMALRGSRDKRNPVAPAAEVISQGLTHFADHCASCHANDGSGQTEMGQHLYPRVPDMRLARTQELTDGGSCSPSSRTVSASPACPLGVTRASRASLQAGTWCTSSGTCRASRQRNGSGWRRSTRKDPRNAGKSRTRRAS